jgi:hypothetical protein
MLSRINRTEAGSDQVSLVDVIDAHGLLVPELRTVLVKGNQAALTRRSDPPLTALAPLSPRGRGCERARA